MTITENIHSNNNIRRTFKSQFDLYSRWAVIIHLKKKKAVITALPNRVYIKHLRYITSMQTQCFYPTKHRHIQLAYFWTNRCIHGLDCFFATSVTVWLTSIFNSNGPAYSSVSADWFCSHTELRSCADDDKSVPVVHQLIVVYCWARRVSHSLCQCGPSWRQLPKETQLLYYSLLYGREN